MVRNDYTAQDPPPMDNSGLNSSGMAYFGLSATLFQGKTVIPSQDVTSLNFQPLGVPQNGLESGTTAIILIDMATMNHNISNMPKAKIFEPFLIALGLLNE